jgi:hypothetical protein
MLQFAFVRVVTTISRRGIDRCRNISTTYRQVSKCRSLSETSDTQFSIRAEELCASLRIVGKRESKDPEFQKEYLKLVDEEPTAVIPDEIERWSKRTSARS